jgi:LysR family transcriptional regulator, glycine cleavage system transcriptional activator
MPNRIDLRKLPPLKSLKGFEAATRHQSIREAADELCLTHPAVSHQVQLIEEALGISLFAQEGRRIVSTPEGRVLYPYVRAAFESLIEGVEAVHRHATDKPLRVQAYVTASIRWLAPRAPGFLKAHPNLSVTMNTCAPDWEFDDVHADVGLVYCETPPADKYHWTPLFDYCLTPVCTPGMAAKLGPTPQPEGLADQPLIMIHTERLNWQTWFESAGVAFNPNRPYILVDTLAVALELALAGEAVALVNGPFVERELADGRLVRPVAHIATCPGAWGLICRAELRDSPRIRAFIDWMSADAAMATSPAYRPLVSVL